MIYDPRSRGAESYFEVSQELLSRDGVESPRAVERKAAASKRGNVKIRFWPYA
jgi:chromosome partitioning protein